MATKIPTPRQIAIRFNPDDYKRLDDKRHAEDTTWQTVGTALWMAWLEGKTASGAAAGSCLVCGQPLNAAAPPIPAEDRQILAQIVETLARDRTAISLVNTFLSAFGPRFNYNETRTPEGNTVTLSDIRGKLELLEGKIDDVLRGLGSGKTAGPTQHLAEVASATAAQADEDARIARRILEERERGDLRSDPDSESDCDPEHPENPEGRTRQTVIAG